MKPLLLVLFTLIFTASEAQLSTALVAHWPLDRNAEDVSGNGHHGTLIGTGMAIKDRFQNFCAWGLKDAQSYIVIEDSIPIDTNMGVSFSFWSYSKANNPKDYDYLAVDALLFDTATCAQYDCVNAILEQTTSVPNPTCSLWVNSGRYGGRYGFRDCSIEQWNHYVFTFSPLKGLPYSDLNIYKNNALLGHLRSYFPVPLHRVVLGKANTEWNEVVSYTYGLDDVRIYHGELSSADVEVLFRDNMSCTVTRLETTFHSQNDPKLMAAVDIMGRTITDLSSYKGAVILLYSDGRREKRVQ